MPNLIMGGLVALLMWTLFSGFARQQKAEMTIAVILFIVIGVLWFDAWRCMR